MSTFCGRMREYSEISIDRFDGGNLLSSVFFLSHCHRDHMTGLNYRSFAKRLQAGNNIYLYMSDVSKVLLLGDNTYSFHHLEPYIKTLQIKRPSTITIPCNTVSGKPKLVSVTLLPAGHCPGSVMFLFEGNEGTVLYTGDFRWEKDKAASLSHLHNELGIKPIKSLYIDTTFCVPNALHFPSRYQCVEVTVQLVKEWLSHSKSHFVYIASPMNYGHEHLQVEIFKHTNEPIHTSDWKYSIYTQIQDLAIAYTTDPSARIHACVSKLLVLRPSTMWFTMSTICSEKLKEEPTKSSDPHRVCYSLHSSYSEIKNFVSYLNPEEVFPNVIPAQEPNAMLVRIKIT
ncbi:hypothetical protein LOTGIDRAFT_209646 [Lottia gigantea]|uniref:Protein artemis n=1 Tax=Lottia gigantea TaxID=225164 RepID=V4A3J4_LOTGI|nr:hypothetical protein LOTGIDRAFT_209646 [Lottia gigantea]ESO91307.1 hypothetical protein LOTGIDRAFT_209646 [Lottia gigantea]